MWRRKQRVVTGLTMILSVLVIVTVIQSWIIRDTQRQNESLRAEVARLDELRNRSEVISNELAQTRADTPRQIQPSREILRLRGEVGLLRRQLQELQQSEERLDASSREAELKTLQHNSLSESMRLAHLSEKLSETQAAADRAQTILSIGPEDPLLKAMLQQVGLAEQKVQRLKTERGVDDGDVQDTSNWIAALNGRIEKRCEALLMARQARVTAMEAAAENLQAEIAATQNIPK
jgi:hypothetical protein